jgi:hypothetical protein
MDGLKNQIKPPEFERSPKANSRIVATTGVRNTCTTQCSNHQSRNTSPIIHLSHNTRSITPSFPLALLVMEPQAQYT